MDRAAAESLYHLSRTRRTLELLVRPSLAIAGVAMVVYTIVKMAPLLKEARAFLASGLGAWFAAAPVALILVPFLLLYGVWSARTVYQFWADAASTATLAIEGAVTLATSHPYAFMSGRSYVSGTATRLSVGGHMFTNLPNSTIVQLREGDVVRVVCTPRVQPVIELVRLARAGG